jgi:aldehyde dehydrogenase (NAD+)
MNSGQACVAGTRILVPLAQGGDRNRAGAGRGGGEIRRPARSATDVGPMVSEKQWLRVQGYIRKGIEEGARLLAGGEGRPDGTRTAGLCVRRCLPT